MLDRLIARATETFVDGKYNFYIDIIPSHSGNLAFLIVNAIFLVYQVCVGIYTRQWWFATAFFCGCALEFMGFLGRFMGSSAAGVSNEQYYTLQVLGLTIAPSFFAAGMYYTFGKLIVIHGQKYSALKASMFSWLFVFCDLFSICIQGAGGGMATSESHRKVSVDPGTYVMVAGLATQALSMMIFLVLWLIFLVRVTKATRQEEKGLTPETEPLFNPKYDYIRKTRYFKVFIWGYTIANVLIFTRCVYRVVELGEGWTGYLATTEIYMFILDGMLISLALLLMSIFHPGLVFGKESVIPVLNRHVKKIDNKNQKDLEIMQDSEGSRDDEGSFYEKRTS